MNHLAHCFLSFDQEDMLVGNFIGDFVKGSHWKAYPEGVQRGILLHRFIDTFTDSHAMTHRSVARLRPFAGRYAPPVVDILYDHLLALHWSVYSAERFDDFAQKMYTRLANRVGDMPAVLQERLPKMLAGRFLHGNTHRAGVEWVLNRFSLRAPTAYDPKVLGQFFFEEIEGFSEDFNAFFPEMLGYVQAKADA